MDYDPYYFIITFSEVRGPGSGARGPGPGPGPDWSKLLQCQNQKLLSRTRPQIVCYLLPLYLATNKVHPGYIPIQEGNLAI